MTTEGKIIFKTVATQNSNCGKTLTLDHKHSGLKHDDVTLTIIISQCSWLKQLFDDSFLYQKDIQ